MLTRSIIDRMKPGQLVHHFLLASYLYYQWHLSPLTDDAFDRLCQRLLEHYDGIEHPHKYLIDKGELEAGTGFYIREDEYPTIVRYGADAYNQKCKSGEMANLLEPHLNPIALVQQQLF